MFASRRRSAAALLLAVIAALLVVSSPTQAMKKPRIKFAGLKWATTCIPGPVREGETTSYHLEWEAAKAKTSRRKIVYNVYEATTPGGENYSQPTYTTAPGVTSFDTPSSRSKTPTTSSYAQGIGRATKTRTPSSAKAKTCVSRGWAGD